MEKPETTRSIRIDAGALSLNELNAGLASLAASVEVIDIEKLGRFDGVGPAFQRNCRLTLHGDLGDYGFYGLSNAELEIRGSAGTGLGESMESGSIIVHADVADAAGAFNRGGMVAIYGCAGRRIAAGMCGGDVIVKQSIGSQGAYAMKAGTLLVLGSTGAMLGQEMTGGTLYVRGTVESIAPQLEESRLKESDRLKISLLFLKAGIEAEVRDLRAFRVATSP